MKKRFKTLNVIAAIILISSFVAYSFPQRCEAAIAPARIIQAAAAVLWPQYCSAGVVEQLCSSVTNFLNDESAKANADLEACKKNCGWKKRKDDLLEAAKKKAKESCSKGEAPDINEINKGLDAKGKDRLKAVYENNSRMFDGKAKLEAANFGAVSSKDASITGKGGKLTDLKTYEPATPKLKSTAGLFGSGSAGLSGEASYSGTVKQESVISASTTTSAKISTNTASALLGKSILAAAAVATPAKTAALAAEKSEWDYESCDACLKAQPNHCFNICCKEQPNNGWCETACGLRYEPDYPGYPDVNKDYCDCCKRNNSNCYNSYYCPSGGGTGTGGILDKIKAALKKVKDLWHKYVFKEEPCGGGYNKIATQCCTVKNTVADKCGGGCPDPDTEYCGNQTICKNTCSAGVISASPAATSGEVILAIGETARLTVSGEKGDALEWWASGGTLTPSADNKQTTITSKDPGKITVTFGSKNCSKCRTNISVVFVKVASFIASPKFIHKGETIKFTLTTEPLGAAYLKQVAVTVYAATNPPPPGSWSDPPEKHLEGDKAVWIYQFNEGASFELIATAGGSDKGKVTGLLQVY